MSKDKNDVVSLEAYRRKKQEEREQDTDTQGQTPRKVPVSSSADHETQGSSGNTPPEKPERGSYHRAFKQAMSHPIIMAEELPEFMQCLLQTMNEDLPLIKQKYPDVKIRSLSYASIPLTSRALPKDILDNIREDFANALENEDPYHHYRIQRRVEQASAKNPGENKHFIVKDEFNKAFIATTPVYNSLAGHLRKVFPEAALSPQMMKVAEDIYQPCLRMEIPSQEGRDIRDVIKSYLKRKAGQPDLHLV